MPCSNYGIFLCDDITLSLSVNSERLFRVENPGDTLSKRILSSMFGVGIAITLLLAVVACSQPVEIPRTSTTGSDEVHSAVRTQEANGAKTAPVEPARSSPTLATPLALDTSVPTPTLPEKDETETSNPSTQIVIKTRLEATNPETVQLASGNLQLVEFFAFW
jgi:hypothetical protein